MAYASWERFAFALGYLANEAHYRNKNDRGLIELHFESNDVQGAWGKEGRIQYYGKENYLALRLADWYYTKSAGNGRIPTIICTLWCMILASKKKDTGDIPLRIFSPRLQSPTGMSGQS